MWGIVCGCGQRTHKSVALFVPTAGCFPCSCWSSSIVGDHVPCLAKLWLKLCIHVVHAHMFYTCHSKELCCSVSGCTLCLLSLSRKRWARLWLAQSIWLGEGGGNATTSRTQSKPCIGAANQEISLQKLATALQLPSQYIYNIFVCMQHNVCCWESFYCTIGIFICLQRADL